MRVRIRAGLIVALGCAPQARAAELKPAAVQAFQRYVRAIEAGMERELRTGGNFLWVTASPERERQARAGQIPVARQEADSSDVPGGLIHDWTGAVFLRGATLARTLAVVQDYDRHKSIYQPEVLDSKLIRRNGDEFHVYLRLMKKKVLTVVLDTEHEARYVRLDGQRCYSRSRSTRVAEVINAGRPGERTLPPDQGHGFLWRLNSYWRFQQEEGGVWVECRAISLTRDVPRGLGWLVEPIIRSLPRESLERTLEATRAAVPER